ncbi:hypothetical protein M8818_001524 [Zalaria obscura]|uniref:Uncharacterized protein n=1 Tax=Zalaria obscura TaxID=2024903 RepID=A0ACC3SKY8_9PEZI
MNVGICAPPLYGPYIKAQLRGGILQPATEALPGPEHLIAHRSGSSRSLDRASPPKSLPDNLQSTFDSYRPSIYATYPLYRPPTNAPLDFSGAIRVSRRPSHLGSPLDTPLRRLAVTSEVTTLRREVAFLLQAVDPSEWESERSFHEGVVAAGFGAVVYVGHEGLVQVKDVAEVVQGSDSGCFDQSVVVVDRRIVDLNTLDVVVGGVVQVKEV